MHSNTLGELRIYILLLFKKHTWEFGDLGIWRSGDLEIWEFGDLGTWGNLGFKKEQSKFKSILPKMSARSGLVGKESS